MIPATYPSVLDSSNRTKMLVYQVPSITGLTRWVDYIPVKSPASESDLSLANTYANEGFILTSKVNDITGLVPFKDYVPIYLDSTATKAWSADNDGYIPMSELAGLLLDFTTGALDPRINFTRTTNATVTNSAGLITYAPHNLLTYSEQFDNAAWTKTNSTVTANSSIAPNSTTSADSIVVTTSGATETGVRTSTTQANSTTYTSSIYVKYTNTRYFVIRNLAISAALGDQWVFFDLVSGTVATKATGITATITPVGNDWYRCTASAATLASIVNNLIDFRMSNIDGGYSVTTGNTILLWGAQLEIGSTATTYNPTTVKNLLGFTQEFDNAAWTKSNSFVQSNLFTFSEEFENTAWTTNSTNISVTANNTTSPTGYQTADKIIPNTTNIAHIVRQFISITSGIVYTQSMYVKASEYSIVQIATSTGFDGGGTLYRNFNLSNGTLGNGTLTASITAVGNNWYRISATSAATSTTTSGRFNINILNADTASANPAYSGDGTSGLFIWGAQVVQGAVAGDYVRTSSTVMPVMYQAPNSTLSADKLVETTANSQHVLRGQSIAYTLGTTYVFSCYVKAAERTAISVVSFNGATDITSRFNLSTGTKISGNGSITNVGNGWYRVSNTFTNASAVTTIFGCQVYLEDSAGNTTYTGDGTSGLYVWGAQLSDSASLDPYVYNPVSAPTAQAYYAPRFDYDPVTLQPKGLLIEEARTNIVIQSENISSTPWVKSIATTTLDAGIVDPSGRTGTVYYPAISEITQTFNGNSATTISVSFFGKKRTGSSNDAIVLDFFQQTAGTAVNLGSYAFQMAVSNPDATYVKNVIRTQYPNGWFRFTFQLLANTGAGAGNFTATSRIDIEGGIAQNYIWGIQIELNAFATSYIPTQASQVTRAADTAVIQGSNFSSWYNQNEGTVYSEASSFSTRPIIAIDDGSMNNRYQITFGTGYIPNFAAVSNGAVSADLYTTSLTQGSSARITGAYKLNDFALSANGSFVPVDTSGALPSLVNIMRLGAWQTGAILNGHIKSINYYPQRLSNATLQAITS